MALSAGTVRTVTVAGVTFKASRRTTWHLRWTIWMLKLRHPNKTLSIFQTCYHTGVDASAGTHDFDACLDVWIEGMDPWKAQTFLRRRGWAAWFRHPPLFGDHIHMVSIPPGLRANPTADEVAEAFARLGIRVGAYVPGQVDDYYAHAYGLAGQHRAGSDDSWFPDSINRTVFRRRWWFNRIAR